MKQTSTPQSAFYSLRLLIGTCLLLTGVLLGPLGLGLFSAQAQSASRTAGSVDPRVPAGFDCSKIHALGIDRQENLLAGAIMIYCGQAAGGSPVSFGEYPITQQLLAPLAYGGADVDLVTGTETFARITQSETFTTANPDNPNQIVVAYNDSRGDASNPVSYSGASVSNDGGVTFTRLTTASGQSPFPNTFGDPVVLYHKPDSTWYTVWLDAAAGVQGLGGFKSTNPSDPNSWTHFVVHNNSSDDRESGWADNNPASPFYGRMYISWNDFNVGGGALFVTRSDNGSTWTPAQVTTGVPFVRDVQITGDLSGNGVVYLAGMDEGGGGFPHNNINKIYKSTDGGATWTNTYSGPSFPGPGVTAVGCFACMFPDIGGYWRHEGWGQPAAFNNVVHLIYAQHGAGADAGDVYYIRSTDGGVTFGAPFKLNSDTTTRPQWQPNISVSPSGTLLATWYDARESTNCTIGNPAVPCYRMWSRKSLDNGATWLADDAFSDVITPLPAQPDLGVQSTYAGDYDYGSALITKHVTSWTDGRVTISGQSQQDAFTDRDLVGFAVTSANPACGSVISTQPTDFVLNLSDAVKPASVQASDFTVNGAAANSVALGSGNTQMTFHFNSSPVTTQGIQTMHIPAGALNRASDNMGNLDFTCTFSYDALLLQVTSTVPADGGTFSPQAPNDYQYDVNFNEPVAVASVQTSDLTVSGNSGPSVKAVSVVNGSMTARFTLHMNCGGSLTASIPAGAITDQFGNPGAAFSGSYSVEGSVCGWAPGPNMPSVGVRSVGVYFPANGKFYEMGGRSSDSAGSDFMHPFEYDPATNAWATKAATYPDNQVNNMACGVLTDAGTPYIYCVGGSAAGGTTAASRVFRYNPVTDAISSVAAPWPGAMGTILPGGFTVSGNKFYVFGGFNINIGMTDAIWQFTPSPAGWVQKSSHLPTALGYIPTTTIGSLIYTAGGSTWDGTTLHDSTASFVFDPVADTINNIASIPRATAETRALNFNNQMLVMGGGRDAPNPSNEVDVYDPGTNTWSTSISPFATARRNFGTDTNGTTTIWVAGGYASDGVTPLNSMEIFECTSTSDTVTITKAVYKTSNSQLLVQANDSDPSAVLTVTVTSSGEQLGRMQTRGDGRYQLKKGGIANPLNITVTSSLGGTDSSNVRSR